MAKEEGSELFFLKSYLDDKGRILGFDEKGHPINTNQMHEKKEALKKDVFPKEILFRIILDHCFCLSAVNFLTIYNDSSKETPTATITIINLLYMK